MIRSAILLALLGLTLADYGYKPKTNKCFQCEFRPPKTHTYTVPRQESYDVQVPVHSQECHEEQVLAGHKVTRVEKRTYSSFRPSYGYGHQQTGYGNQVHQQGYGDQGHQQGYGSSYQQPESYHNSEPVYKTVKKCVPKVEYKTESRYRTAYDTKTETGKSGGFEPCMGPITAESAKADGVDDWECYSACYTRKDAYGNIARGCYKGEFGVNPNGYGPQSINGQTYWFCQGDHCNGGSMK